MPARSSVPRCAPWAAAHRRRGRCRGGRRHQASPGCAAAKVRRQQDSQVYGREESPPRHRLDRCGAATGEGTEDPLRDPIGHIDRVCVAPGHTPSTQRDSAPGRVRIFLVVRRRRQIAVAAQGIQVTRDAVGRRDGQIAEHTDIGPDRLGVEDKCPGHAILAEAERGERPNVGGGGSAGACCTDIEPSSATLASATAERSCVNGLGMRMGPRRVTDDDRGGSLPPTYPGCHRSCAYTCPRCAAAR
jgi:hypothetical protein